MYNFRSLLFLVVFVMVAMSCTRLKTGNYVGEKIAVFAEYANEVSIWQEGKNVFFLKPINQYRAMLSTLVWDNENGRFQQVDRKILVSRLSDYTFLNLEEDGRYTILRMAGTLDGRIVIFEARQEKLAADEISGVIKTKDGDGSEIFDLDMSKEEVDEYIAKNIIELFELNSVSIIVPIVPFTEKRTAETPEPVSPEDSSPEPSGPEASTPEASTPEASTPATAVSDAP